MGEIPTPDRPRLRRLPRHPHQRPPPRLPAHLRAPHLPLRSRPSPLPPRVRNLDGPPRAPPRGDGPRGVGAPRGGAEEGGHGGLEHVLLQYQGGRLCVGGGVDGWVGDVLALSRVSWLDAGSVT